MMLSLQTLQKTLIAGLTVTLLSFAAILLPVALSAPLAFAPAAAATISTSHNWSGYTAANGTFTSVSGMWTIPSASSSGHAAADATWVGIGGIRRNDLVQGGTQNIIGSSGQISTTAFIEMLPRASQHIPMSVNPGDSITVAVAQQSQDQWQFSFVDNTNGQTYFTTLAYHSSLSSAEWIEEDPSSRARLLPLDNFGPLQFSDSSAIENGSSVNIAQANGQAMTMLDANCQALATPSALGGDGASFTITRSAVDTTTPDSAPQGSERGWRRDGSGIGQYPGGNQNCLVAPNSEAGPSTPPVLVPRPSPNFWGRWFRFFGR